MSSSHAEDRTPVVLAPGQGRAYPMGRISASVPGPFEPEMPGIAAWFAENPPEDTGN